jgi:hypothetical protein
MSNIFTENLGILALLTAFLGLGLSLYNFIKLREITRLKKLFFTGTGDVNLENALNSLAQNVKNLQDEQMISQQHLQELQNILKFAVQKVGLVRFNPFAESGGNFSFSLALLDDTNSGVVLTSMHGREQNRVYTKTINNGRSETQLTEEELQAVKNAYQNKHIN